jgi:hypothetical protein
MLGLAIFFANFIYMKNVMSDDNVEKTYNKLVENECYLNDWLVQEIQIGHNTSVKSNVSPIKSNLDLTKYNAGLKIRVYKRIISVDGQNYTINVDKDAKFSTFEKANFFVYECSKNNTFKTRLGFFDRVRGVPQ